MLIAIAARVSLRCVLHWYADAWQTFALAMRTAGLLLRSSQRRRKLGGRDPIMLYFLYQDYGDTPQAIAPFAREVRGSRTRHSTGTGSDEGVGQYSVALVREDACRKTNNRLEL